MSMRLARYAGPPWFRPLSGRSPGLRCVSSCPDYVPSLHERLTILRATWFFDHFSLKTYCGMSDLSTGGEPAECGLL